jgi:uncharacterized membrane protein
LGGVVNHPSFISDTKYNLVLGAFIMAQTKKSQAKNSKETFSLKSEPWIPMRNGIIIISFTSVGMTVLTALQAIPSKGWVEGLLWSLLFGALIWAVFFGLILVNRFLKR